MEAVLQTVPEAQHQEAARSLTRAWFADLVQVFNHAAVAGKLSAVWVPRAQYWLDGNRSLNNPVSAAELGRMAAQASRNCRSAQLKAVPHCEI